MESTPPASPVKSFKSPPRTSGKNIVGWVYIWRIPFEVISTSEPLKLCILNVGMAGNDGSLLKRLYHERNDFIKILTNPPDIPYSSQKQKVFDIDTITGEISQGKYADLCCLIPRTHNDVPTKDTETFIRSLVGLPLPSHIIDTILEHIQVGNKGNLSPTELVITNYATFTTIQNEFCNAYGPLSLSELTNKLAMEYKVHSNVSVVIRGIKGFEVKSVLAVRCLLQPKDEELEPSYEEEGLDEVSRRLVKIKMSDYDI